MPSVTNEGVQGMQYEGDFSGPALDGTPADQVLFGAEPALWLVFLAVALLAAVVGWWLGRSGRDVAADAAERIWDDIHHAITRAMKAGSHDLPGRAARVREVVESRLGQTLRLSSGLSAPLDAIGCALDGRRVPHDPATAPQRPEEVEHGAGARSASAPSASAVVTIITPGGDNGGGGHAGHGAGDHGHAPLSPRERNAALRGALDDLHDRWSVRGARIAEMRAAHRELSGVDLPRDHGPHPSHGH